jgi:hypothetical protein
MQCNQFEQILEKQDAGPLPEQALSHIDVCEGCRTLLADFWWSAFQRPALAGAFLGVLLAAGTLLSYHQGSSTEMATRAQEEIAQEASTVPSGWGEYSEFI